MFDVASGEAELVEFLLTRFDSMDLKTRINIDATARVIEQLAPVKAAPEQAAQPAVVLSEQDLETVNEFIENDETPVPALPETAAPALPAAQDPDLMTLIQGFYQAAQRYQSEVSPEPPEPAQEEEEG